MLIFLQDWWLVTSSSGKLDLIFIAKLGVDAVLAIMAGIRLAGPSLFAEEDDDDEVAIHEEDLHFSDSALFGVAFLNILLNCGYHVYLEVTTTDAAVGSYYLFWILGEMCMLALTFILFKHAQMVQRKLARKSRQEATAAGMTPRRVS